MKKIILLLFLFATSAYIYSADSVIDNMEFNSNLNAQASWVSSMADTTTVLLLHGNMTGFDSNVISDDSFNKFPIGNIGLVHIDTTLWYKFEPGSMIFDGTSMLKIQDDNSWDLSSTTGTVDFWLKFVQLDNNTRFFGQVHNSVTTNNWAAYAYSNGSVAMGKVGVSETVSGAGVISASNTVWQHVAFVKNTDSTRLYVDGVYKFAYPNSIWQASSDSMYVGGFRYSGTSSSLNGRIDEFRFSKPTVRWSSDFTPPTAPYADTNIVIQTDTSDYTQGSYSLELIFDTTSANGYVSHTFALNNDYTCAKNLGIDMKASRSGQNIALGFSDTGGNTTWCTTDIDSANVWQNVSWDIGAVSNANKDAVNNIFIKNLNADSINTCNVDWWHISQISSFNSNGTFDYDTSNGRGSSLNCWKITPNSSVRPFAWEFMFPVTETTQYNYKYYAKKTSDFNGSVTFTIYDTDRKNILSNSKIFSGLNTTYVGDTTTVTPTSTGFNYGLIRIFGDTGSVYFDDLGK